MRIIVATITGFTALAAIAAQAPPNPNTEGWRPLGAALSLGLGDHACGEDRYQVLRRDWRGDWWWGPCAPNR